MRLKRFRKWLPAISILEIGVLLMSFAAMGKRRSTSPGEGNKIARLVLEEPGAAESFIFYFVTGHILIGLILFAAWVAARRKKKPG